jgi:hypothetical protein
MHDELAGDEDKKMKLPLRIAPVPYNLKRIRIVDATGRVICNMDFDDLAFAERIVRRENGWWLTLFDAPRDKKQRDHDRWVMQSANHYNDA